MSGREPFDSGDIKLAELGGDVKALVANVEGLRAVVDVRLAGLERELDGVQRSVRGAFARLDDHRETIDRDVAALEKRVRALEQRPPPSKLGLSKHQRNALIAILAAIASALGFGGGAGAAKLLEQPKPPQQESKQ